MRRASTLHATDSRRAGPPAKDRIQVERITSSIYAVCAPGPGGSSTSILDFANQRLVTFAGAKGPAYVRRTKLAFIGRGRKTVVKQRITTLPPALHARVRRRLHAARRQSVRPKRTAAKRTSYAKGRMAKRVVMA